ncbi:MAG: hypothetical protein K6C99_10920 [Lachnospiraceae bacterium]|nr:hypothetical protein [Lachnospiraceae bacterium]
MTYKRIFIGIVLAIMFFVTVPFSGGKVQAGDISCIFNAAYYAAVNPDLAAIYGNDERALLTHFENYGMAEGRRGSAEFDVVFYINTNPDLVAVFGSDLKSYYLHYMNSGKAEGRRGCEAAGVDPVVDLANADSVTLTMMTKGYSQYLPHRIGYIPNFPGVFDLYPGYVPAYNGPGTEYGIGMCVGGDFIQPARIVNGWAAITLKGQTYYINENDLEQNYRQTAGLAMQILPGIVGNRISDKDKIQAVHDWMCNNYCYDYSLNSDNGYEILVTGTGTCEAYSEAFDLFMGLLDIPCVLVRGDGNGGYHAWNRVVADGELLEIDVTWDDQQGWIARDWFLKPSLSGHVEEDYR